EYNELFGGDPMWITESVGGMGQDGRTLVSKTSYRMLNTLYNLGTSPEPNLTILWSENLPEAFKRFCAKLSIDTDAIQYENDDIMRDIYGDDYAIACCVSAMTIGKQMQFFGARCNLPKLLLLALNGGMDENKNIQLGPKGKIFDADKPLDYDEVMEAVEKYRKWLCALYVNTMNIIHFMHDKYAYEKTQMALHDTDIEHTMAFGVSGLSVITDSLSAIKYAKVTPIKNEKGLICDFETVGEFPKYGNDDDRVDQIAVEMVRDMESTLKETPTYKNAKHKLSVLTITSNVMYGKKTGATPDGRKKGEPFAPGANPMHNREINGALASLNSVAKISYDYCRDGVSNTFSIIPSALGKDMQTQVTNLVSILTGYFKKKAHHINVNVIDREKLVAAFENPDLYPNLTIRVSGYAVNFHKLSKEQQKEVIMRTFHSKM
ncbi:MAG: pyruvate formate lyase family protein, partial [Oscillospiraceae bacterium]